MTLGVIGRFGRAAQTESAGKSAGKSAGNKLTPSNKLL